MVTLYGIKNCDTVKKAKKWLEAQQIDYQFHDLRIDGLSKETLLEWVNAVGWETLVNKRSTTWKQLDEKARSNMDKTLAIETMLAQPTLIKRPVLVTKTTLKVGFNAADYEQLF